MGRKGIAGKDDQLRRDFGISLAQYNNLLAQQNNVCYICHNEDKHNRRLAVDHCHLTSIVRGLLCTDCNIALGAFYDSIDIIKMAIKYLEKELPNLGEIGPRYQIIPYKFRSWTRHIIQTPDGTFSSYTKAAEFYEVSNTTIRQWCGNNSKKLHLKKIGFTKEEVFASIDQDGNIIIQERKTDNKLNDAAIDNNLRRDYGISLRQYNKLLLDQNNKCCICSQNPINQRLSIDHIHLTGQVRGLLCNHCNTSLGRFNDDIILLKRIIEYLEKSAPELGEFGNRYSTKNESKELLKNG